VGTGGADARRRPVDEAVRLTALKAEERLCYAITQEEESAMALIVKTGLDVRALVGSVRAANSSCSRLNTGQISAHWEQKEQTPE
jgi:hypothetical protein